MVRRGKAPARNTSSQCSMNTTNSSAEGTNVSLNPVTSTPVSSVEARATNGCVRRLPIPITPGTSNESASSSSNTPDRPTNHGDDNLQKDYREFMAYQKDFNEKLLAAIRETKESDGQTSRKRECLPLKLTEDVRAIYKEKELAVQKGENLPLWDFQKSFASPENEQVNSSISSGVLSTATWSAGLLRDAIRTHFKTKKRRWSLKQKNADEEYKKMQRRRSRLNTKRLQRTQALAESTSITSEDKTKYKEVMAVEYMSSDESMSDGNENPNTVSDSEEELPPQKKKVLVRKQLRWRSHELNNLIKKLDRKLSRKRSSKAQSMVVPRRDGGPSARASPEEAPDWAIEL